MNLWKYLREDSLNRLACEVERALDMRAIFAWAGLTYDLPLSEDMLSLRGAGVAR
jgi:adenosylcobyric acid synthase